MFSVAQTLGAQAVVMLRLQSRWEGSHGVRPPILGALGKTLSRRDATLVGGQNFARLHREERPSWRRRTTHCGRWKATLTKHAFVGTAQIERLAPWLLALIREPRGELRW